MKNNLMVRLMTLFILMGMGLAHFSGQVDLLSAYWLWLAIMPALMGFQATFTGFCPAGMIGKLSKSGECCPGGSCGTNKTAAPEKATAKASDKACCAGSAEDLTTKQATSCCGSDSKENASTASSCCDSQKETEKTDCCSGSTDGLEIKVLGTGCANCKNTVKAIQTTADELAIKVNVIKIEDIAEIAAYGIMTTPSVVINEEVVHSGGIPSKKVITEWLSA